MKIIKEVAQKKITNLSDLGGMFETESLSMLLYVASLFCSKKLFV